jgi:malonyl-CoA O-methyltransferase
MNVIQEFSRFANQYDSYNFVQSQVAQKLVSMIKDREYPNIVDIGCGSGSIYKNIIDGHIHFDKFTALDLSKEMLEIHPTSSNVKKIYFDFNNSESFSTLQGEKYDLLLSSSSLQWSQDLDMTLDKISRLSKEFYFSFFTSNTFSKLHEVAGISSPIHSEDRIKDIVNRYFFASFEVVEYRLEFENIRKMFQYIKRSGVSGGERRLGYKQMRDVMKNYPLNYLEFEVLFIKATPNN